MLNIHIEIGVNEQLASILERFIQALNPPQTLTYSVRLEFPTMRILKADAGDFPGKLTVTATDSEGNVTPLPADLVVAGTSDNPAAIELTQDASDKYSFSFHVGGPNTDGTPSQANLVVNVSKADGTLIGTADESFTVTAGDPSLISVGKLDFPTLPVEP